MPFFENFSMMTVYIGFDMSLTQLIDSSFPVFGLDYKSSDYHNIDLSIENSDIRGINVVEGLHAYIKSILKKNGGKVAKGGYAEKRDFYHSSSLFVKGEEKRSIHLGIDLWADAYHPVYAPLDGQLQSVQYNDNGLDYGYTIIMKHSIGSTTFYTLYGHLSDKELLNIRIGDVIQQGQCIARIGDPTTNGGWAPHLHFQIIHDLQNHIGDYPGVAYESEAEYYLSNCPDPEFLVISNIK